MSQTNPPLRLRYPLMMVMVIVAMMMITIRISPPEALMRWGQLDQLLPGTTLNQSLPSSGYQDFAEAIIRLPMPSHEAMISVPSEMQTRSSNLAMNHAKTVDQYLPSLFGQWLYGEPSTSQWAVSLRLLGHAMHGVWLVLMACLLFRLYQQPLMAWLMFLLFATLACTAYVNAGAWYSPVQWILITWTWIGLILSKKVQKPLDAAPQYPEQPTASRNWALYLPVFIMAASSWLGWFCLLVILWGSRRSLSLGLPVRWPTLVVVISATALHVLPWWPTDHLASHALGLLASLWQLSWSATWGLGETFATMITTTGPVLSFLAIMIVMACMMRLCGQDAQRLRSSLEAVAGKIWGVLRQGMHAAALWRNSVDEFLQRVSSIWSKGEERLHEPLAVQWFLPMSLAVIMLVLLFPNGLAAHPQWSLLLVIPAFYAVERLILQHRWFATGLFAGTCAWCAYWLLLVTTATSWSTQREREQAFQQSFVESLLVMQTSKAKLEQILHRPTFASAKGNAKTCTLWATSMSPHAGTTLWLGINMLSNISLDEAIAWMQSKQHCRLVYLQSPMPASIKSPWSSLPLSSKSPLLPRWHEAVIVSRDGAIHQLQLDH